MNLKALLIGITIYAIVTLNIIYFFFYNNDPNQDYPSTQFITLQHSIDTSKSQQEKTQDSQLESSERSILTSSVEKTLVVEEPSHISKTQTKKRTTSIQTDSDAHVSMLLKLLTDNKTMFNQLKKEVLNQDLGSEDSFLRFDGEVLKKYARSAVNPLLKLGLYEDIGDSFENSDRKDSKGTLKTFYGFQHNDRYCEEIDLYTLLHQDQVFSKMNFISDYSQEDAFIRNLMQQELGGGNLFPDLNSSSDPNSQTVKSLPLNVSAFFLKRSQILNYYEVNKEIICFSQMFNHIPGQGTLVRNDLFFKNMGDYSWLVSKKSQGKERVSFPFTFRLDDANECMRFWTFLSATRKEESQNDSPIQYVLKNTYENGSGTEALDTIQEDRLRKKFEGGMYCGKRKESKTIQQYISNPLLLDKENKFGFKIYLLVASTKPLIVYYHDGFLQVSLFKYDKTFQEKDVNITNIHFMRHDFGETIDHDMNEEELEEYRTWLMGDLQSYLLEKGKINNTAWLEEELRPKFQRTLIHVTKMIEPFLYQTSSAFELFELDFQMDDNLHIWFVDASPAIKTSDNNSKRTRFFTKLLKDMFEIQYLYYKSKMRRAFNFINNLLKNSQSEEDINFEKMKEEFNTKININKLEPEFTVKRTNEFRLLVDKNIEGIGAYFGLLSEELL